MPPPATSRTDAPPERVLLVHPGALGDLVQAAPAFGAVRASFPHARITLLTDAGLSAFASETLPVDEVVGFDAQTAYHGSLPSRLRLLYTVARAIRARRPNRVAVFKGAVAYAALAAGSGARVRAGLARGVARRFLTDPIAIDPNRHHEDRYLDVATALGAAAPSAGGGTRWPNRPSRIPASLRDAWPLVGIAPGGARNAKQDMPTKRWPADRFAAAARELATVYPGAAFILLGAASDRAEVDAVRAALPGDRVVDLAGLTDVADARATIAALDLYLGNDSGLMHVAGTTDTPAVIVFGPTDPRVLAPRSPHVRWLWRPTGEAPCYDEIDGRHRPCAPRCCIDRVGVQDVLAAVRALLDRHPDVPRLAGAIHAGRP